MVPNPLEQQPDETLASATRTSRRSHPVQVGARTSGQYNTSLQIVGNGHLRFRCGSSTEVMSYVL
jgi:hypothetical protein